MQCSTPAPRHWLELLESRQMLSAAYPTAIEQYVIELINRARANPSAEAARYGIDLNEGLGAGTISTSSVQPLAVNPYLVDSARKHSKWMIDTDTFNHTGAGGSDPKDRMISSGYVFKSPWSWAENIALRSFKSGGGGAELFDAIEKDLFVDISIAGRGHRINLLFKIRRKFSLRADRLDALPCGERRWRFRRFAQLLRRRSQRHNRRE